MPDPHTPISNTTLNKLGKIGEGLEAVNKAAVPIAITMDVIQLGNAVKTDIQQGTGGDNTIVVASRVAGGWTGACAGAQTGAAVGAGVGAFFGPGPGTAIGGFVGGLVGGIGGAIFGAHVGENVGKEIVNDKNGS